MLTYIVDNKEWLFSGVGVAFVVAIGTWLVRRGSRDRPVQTQLSGSRSVNLQSRGDITINGSLKAGDSHEARSEER